MSTGPTAPGTALPDTEALRRAALQASWARDREVGRRRLRWRWASWALTRVGLPLLCLAAMGGFTALYLQHLDQSFPPVPSVGGSEPPASVRTAPPGPSSPAAAVPAVLAAEPTAAGPALSSALAPVHDPAASAPWADAVGEPTRPALLRLDLGAAAEPNASPTFPQNPSGDSRP